MQVWHVLALAGLLGAINAFDMPGRQALVIQMTSKEDLINAISLNSAVFNAARVLGPGVAGLLLAAVGEGVCFAINGVSFLAVIGVPAGDADPAGVEPAGGIAVEPPGGRLPLHLAAPRWCGGSLLLMAAATLSRHAGAGADPVFRG